MHDWRAAKGFHKVSQIGNSVRTATTFGRLCRIFERAGFKRNFLYLLGEFNRREGWLRNRARTAGCDHFFDVVALVIIGRAWQWHQNRWPSGTGQLGHS
jgi:hypothetical protein